MSAATPTLADLFTPPLTTLLSTPGLDAATSDDGAPVLPCHTNPPDLWFAQDPGGVETAKALCGPCPLRAACLAGALERSEPWGVWGGECVLDGVAVARKRGRGRPRKDTTAASSHPVPSR